MLRQSLYLGLVLLVGYASHAAANPPLITLKQVTQDISILADDKMAGRASFTDGSKMAADYIAQRFSQIGLKPLKGLDSFKQDFVLYQTKPEALHLIFNGKKVDAKKAFLLSNHAQLNWKNSQHIKVYKISQSDDFKQKMSEINTKNEDIILLVDISHMGVFERYKNYFNKPKIAFKVNQGPSVLAVLTSEKTLNTFTVNTKLSVNKRLLTNIVGVLPGSQTNKESVLFSAHYDHLPPIAATDENQQHADKIFNGADDNASGTTAVINLAEYFAHTKKNQRELIFVAFAAEELGGFGSKYFSEKIAHQNIVAMLNIEMIGKVSKFGAGQMWMTGFERSDLAQILNQRLRSQEQKIQADPYPEQKLFYRSDNATLARLGVAAHSFSSTQLDIDQHYHKTSDELKTLDLNSMTQIINSLAVAVEPLIDGSKTPTRIDASQVQKQGYFY